VLLDSITRTARAFNKWVGNTGRTMSGGLDIKALEIPRKMFGTARRFEEGGSLTVVATALIETGSRMDDAIFQEFKGTGNMEMMLSRDLADRRIWPAIDITRSGTRHEENFFTEEEYEYVTMIRRHLITLTPADAMDKLIKMMEKFPSNAEFFEKVRMMM
jgi:transcription termination factor Rho